MAAEYMDPSMMYGFAFCSFYVELKSLSILIVLSNHTGRGNVAFLFMNLMLSFQKQEKISLLVHWVNFIFEFTVKV